MNARAGRLARGTAAASFATFVALLSHTSAGAPIPGPAGVIAPLMLSIVVCVFLAGARTSMLRLSIGVVLSQALFHLLFVLGTGGAVASGPGAASGPGHVHGGPVLLDASGAASLHGAHAVGPEMWLAHAVAAGLTLLMLSRGEATLRHLVSVAGCAAVMLRGLLALEPTPLPLSGAEPAAVDRPRRPLGVYRSTMRHRGPPALAL